VQVGAFVFPGRGAEGGSWRSKLVVGFSYGIVPCTSSAGRQLERTSPPAASFTAADPRVFPRGGVGGACLCLVGSGIFFDKHDDNSRTCSGNGRRDRERGRDRGRVFREDVIACGSWAVLGRWGRGRACRTGPPEEEASKSSSQTLWSGVSPSYVVLEPCITHVALTFVSNRAGIKVFSSCAVFALHRDPRRSSSSAADCVGLALVPGLSFLPQRGIEAAHGLLRKVDARWWFLGWLLPGRRNLLSPSRRVGRSRLMFFFNSNRLRVRFLVKCSSTRLREGVWDRFSNNSWVASFSHR
jgi:hypothetical protein